MISQITPKISSFIQAEFKIISLDSDYLTTRPLLIKGQKNILIDPGLVISRRLKKRYQTKIQPLTLLDFLKHQNLSPSQIDYLILTHLHDDHYSNLFTEEEKVLLFENAKIIVQRREFENQITRVQKKLSLENLELVEGYFKLENLELLPTPGHTIGHQSIICKDKDYLLLIPGDLIPTLYHLEHDQKFTIDYDPDLKIKTKQNLLANFFKRPERHKEIFLYHEPKDFLKKIKKVVDI